MVTAIRNRNGIVNYRSIKKPAGSLSSFGNSLIRQQNAAEDSIIDNQYATGQIDEQTYLANLNQRLGRSYLTPQQYVSLNKKITDVQQRLNDAKVQTAYQAGQLSTTDVYNYEKQKLDQIPQTDSVAYQQQAATVQGLKDKAEKEARAAYRQEQNLSISQMPEDTSARLQAKADEYTRLAHQALIDGDKQASDSFQTSANNYKQAADRAVINDTIANARLSASQTPTQGLGVPDAARGNEFFKQLTGIDLGYGNSTGSGSGDATSGGTGNATGFSGVSNSAVKSALQSLDVSERTINRLNGTLTDQQNTLAAYDTAIAQATGDQKTQLITARNNLADSIDQTKNSIQTEYQHVQDTAQRIQDAQQTAAAKAFNQEVRVNNLNFTKAENDLETSFAKGEINKQEYLAKGLNLAQTKAQFFQDVSNGFNQLGNDSSSEAYMQKATDATKLTEQLAGVASNINDYEQVQVDPGGKMANLSGTAAKPGDFVLTNVRQLRDSGTFDSNYIKHDNKFYIIHYPGQQTDSQGFPISKQATQELAKYKNDVFVYRKGDNGQIVKEPVRYVTTTDQTGKVGVQPFFVNDTRVTVKNPDGTVKTGTDGKPVYANLAGLNTLTKGTNGIYRNNADGTISLNTPPNPSGFDLLHNIPAGVGAIDRFIQQHGGYPRFTNLQSANTPMDARNTKSDYFVFGKSGVNPGILQPAVDVVKDVANVVANPNNPKSLANAANPFSPYSVQNQVIQAALNSGGKIAAPILSALSQAFNNAKNTTGNALNAVKNFFIPQAYSAGKQPEQVYRPQEAIAQIRAAKPDLKLTDQQITDLYMKYGDRLLSEIPGHKPTQDIRNGAQPTPTPNPSLADYGTGAFTPNTPDEFKPLIVDASNKTGIPTGILSSLLEQESSWNPDVISGKRVSLTGAQGIAQFMPATAKGLGIDPLNVKQAILGAAQYLKGKLDQHGSLPLALAAYNAGSGNVQKYGGIPPFAETQKYVTNILNNAKSAVKSSLPKQSVEAASTMPRQSQILGQNQQPKVTGAVTPTLTPTQPRSSATITPQQPHQNNGGFQLPSLPQVQLPHIQLPQFQLPKVSLPQFSIPKPITQTISNVENGIGGFLNNAKNAISGAANNIGKWLGSFKF